MLTGRSASGFARAAGSMSYSLSRKITAELCNANVIMPDSLNCHEKENVNHGSRIKQFAIRVCLVYNEWNWSDSENAGEPGVKQAFW